MDRSEALIRPVIKTYGKRSRAAQPSRTSIPDASSQGSYSKSSGLISRPAGPDVATDNISSALANDGDGCQAGACDSVRAGIGAKDALQQAYGRGNSAANLSTSASGMTWMKDKVPEAPATQENKIVRTATSKPKQISLNSFLHRQASGPASMASESSTFTSSLHPGAARTSKSSTNLTQMRLLPIRLASSSPVSSTSPSTSSRAPSSRYITCPTCQMTYLPSGLGGEDEKNHARYCERVKEGVRWVLPDEAARVGSGNEGGTKRKSGRYPGVVIEQDIRMAGRKGRELGIVGSILCVAGAEAFDGYNKLLDILASVDTVLSAPPLSDVMIKQCKVYLFVTSSSPPAPRPPDYPRNRSSPAAASLRPVDDGAFGGPPRTYKRLRPEEFKLLANAAKEREQKRTRFPVSAVGDGKSRVVGVLVVQPIKWAMRVLTEAEKAALTGDGLAGATSRPASREGAKDAGETSIQAESKEAEDEARHGLSDNSGQDSKRKRPHEDLVVVSGADGSESDERSSLGAVICDPERLPTRLGMHRIFTIPTFRGLGISKVLLDAACKHAIHGHKCDPAKGDVAFSQPTSSGRAVMESWGRGHVRVFVEDEQAA